MKKNKEAGFFLSETMVVMAVVAVVILGVFKIFSSTYLRYKENELYDTSNGLNAISVLLQYYDSIDYNIETLLDNNDYIEITNNQLFNSGHYTNLKNKLGISKIYLVNINSLGTSANNFDLSLRKYLKKLQNEDYQYAYVIAFNNGEFSSSNIKSLNSLQLLGNQDDENSVIVGLNEDFNDPGYVNWNGEVPTIQGLDELDTSKEGVTYLDYNFSGYTLRRKVIVISKEKEFNYTGTSQEYIVPETGWYQVELWGASGGASSSSVAGGKGAYTKGTINLKKGTKLYINVGGMGIQSGASATYTTGGYNGGGSAKVNAGTGGGATDVRYGGTSLNDRIIVAGSGGGAGVFSNSEVGGAGGGLTGIDGGDYDSTYTGGGHGGTQTAGGSLGMTAQGSTTGSFGDGGAGGTTSTNSEGSGGGGAGYYGGGGATSRDGGGGGGSSYISGHVGSVAIVSSSSTAKRVGTNNLECVEGTTDQLCSVHYSNMSFIDTMMIDGNGYAWTNSRASTTGTNLMPNPMGEYYASGVGHTGNGFARITFMGKGKTKVTNLVVNGSFEDGITDLKNCSTCSHSDENSKYGTKTLKATHTNAQSWPRYYLPKPISETGHMLYVTATYYQDNDSLSPLIEIVSATTSDWWPTTTNNYTVWADKDSLAQISNKHLKLSLVYSNIYKYIILMTTQGNTSGTGNLYWDGLMLIDLTETFGAGNEPSKEWCDKYLYYFEGTQYITFDK